MKEFARRYSNMRSKILDSVTEDLLSIPPFIFKETRRKLLRTALIDMDISPIHFGIMKLLYEAGTLHVAEIGERQQIARPQVTHLIDKLVDLEIVERRIDTTDRRMINVALTEKGKTTFEAHDKSIRKAMKETLSCFTDKELDDLSDSLRKLRDLLSKIQ
jgi:DNA-binding MarR family transcriptional regulator